MPTNDIVIPAWKARALAKAAAGAGGMVACLGLVVGLCVSDSILVLPLLSGLLIAPSLMTRRLAIKQEDSFGTHLMNGVSTFLASVSVLGLLFDVFASFHDGHFVKHQFDFSIGIGMLVTLLGTSAYHVGRAIYRHEARGHVEDAVLTDATPVPVIGADARVPDGLATTSTDERAIFSKGRVAC